MSARRSRRRGAPRGSRLARDLLVAGGVAALALVVHGAAPSPARNSARATLVARLGPALVEVVQRARPTAVVPPLQLVVRRGHPLPDAVQDAGAAAVGGRLVLAGGLTANDLSTSSVVVAG